MIGTERDESLWEMLLTYARAFTVTSANLELVRGEMIALTATSEGKYVVDKDSGNAQRMLDALQAIHELCGSIPSLKKV